LGGKKRVFVLFRNPRSKGGQEGRKKEKGVVVVVVVAVVARGNKGATRTRLLALQGQLGHLG
jgi:hypothetical protein